MIFLPKGITCIFLFTIALIQISNCIVWTDPNSADYQIFTTITMTDTYETIEFYAGRLGPSSGDLYIYGSLTNSSPENSTLFRRLTYTLNDEVWTKLYFAQPLLTTFEIDRGEQYIYSLRYSGSGFVMMRLKASDGSVNTVVSNSDEFALSISAYAKIALPNTSGVAYFSLQDFSGSSYIWKWADSSTSSVSWFYDNMILSAYELEAISSNIVYFATMNNGTTGLYLAAYNYSSSTEVFSIEASCPSSPCTMQESGAVYYNSNNIIYNSLVYFVSVFFVGIDASDGSTQTTIYMTDDSSCVSIPTMSVLNPYIYLLIEWNTVEVYQYNIDSDSFISYLTYNGNIESTVSLFVDSYYFYLIGYGSISSPIFLNYANIFRGMTADFEILYQFQESSYFFYSTSSLGKSLKF